MRILLLHILFSSSNFAATIEERLVTIERDIFWHGMIGGALIVFLGIGTFKAVRELWKDMRNEVTSRVDIAVTQQVNAVKDRAESEVKTRVDQTVEKHAREARSLLEFAQTEYNALKSATAAGIHIEAGDTELSFAGGNYQKKEVQFSRPFRAPPQIFLTESVAGEWLYAKVDTKDAKGFLMAVRTLSGAASAQKTRIQWMAIETGSISWPMSEPTAAKLTPAPEVKAAPAAAG